MLHKNSVLKIPVFLFILLVLGCSSPKEKPLSVQMAESCIQRNPEGWMLDFSTKLKWNYCHGLVGKAMLDVYDAYGDDQFYEYMRQYADTMIAEDGSIFGYKMSDFNIDRVNSGKILFRIAEHESNPKYTKALHVLRDQLKEHPRTTEGGFWHKKRYPCQMWLDGLYMGAPFYAEYAKVFNESKDFDDVALQFKLIKKHLYDAETGLYRHGWDECLQQQWADSITGQSSHVWGRAVGWYAMALVDALDFFPADHPDRDTLISIFQDLSAAIVKFQDADSHVWYQVLDQGDREGNYLESTCSTMFVYSFLKGVRMGYLDEKYLSIGQTAYQGILDTFIQHNDDGSLSITNCCSVAGLGGNPYRSGSYEYYINEPIRDNDPKAVGPFIMASLEMEKVK